MILPDVNVLVYAFNKERPEHAAYAGWLTSALGSAEEIALTGAVLSGFVRITTNPRIWSTPAPTSAALAFVDALLAAPAARWTPSTRAVWETFDRLCGADRHVRGNLVPDAYLAALAIAHGARLATADRGFARFPGLRWFDPTASTD